MLGGPGTADGRLGRRGEDLAAGYLRRCGYRILATSYRCELGEIDLVARAPATDGGAIVFVEVKTRRSADRGDPWQAVGRTKQRKIARLALAFLKSRKLLDRPVRFDVVGIVWPAEPTAEPRLEHYPAAYSADP